MNHYPPVEASMWSLPTMDVDHVPKRVSPWLFHIHVCLPCPIGSMYAIYGNIHHQYTPNVSIYTIHGSYGCGIFYLNE